VASAAHALRSAAEAGLDLLAVGPALVDSEALRRFAGHPAPTATLT
jgi:hypothetical protein